MLRRVKHRDKLHQIAAENIRQDRMEAVGNPPQFISDLRIPSVRQRPVPVNILRNQIAHFLVRPAVQREDPRKEKEQCTHHKNKGQIKTMCIYEPVACLLIFRQSIGCLPRLFLSLVTGFLSGCPFALLCLRIIPDHIAELIPLFL